MSLSARLLTLSPFILLLAACSPTLPVERVVTVVVNVTQTLAPEPVPTEALNPASTPVPDLLPTVTSQPTAEPTPNQDIQPPSYRLQPGDLILAADIDDIPAIFANDDLFVDAETGSQEWPAEELVIALEINGDARAYPIRLLSLHEIVNDVVGGKPVAVTWCPLCFSALVFDRVVDRELTFGVSGYLFKENLVMYDHQTNTLWSQLLAQGIKGGLTGEHLALVPSVITAWGEWKEAHPTTRILSADRLGRMASEIIDPYAGYYTAGGAGLTADAAADTRLPSKALVVGVVFEKEAQAYPLQRVADERLINDRVGDIPVLLIFDEALEAVIVYRARVEGQELTFVLDEPAGFVRDEQTGSRWESRTGRALDGPLEGSALARLSAPLVFWFAWSDIHPATDVYAP